MRATSSLVAACSRSGWRRRAAGGGRVGRRAGVLVVAPRSGRRAPRRRPTAASCPSGMTCASSRMKRSQSKRVAATPADATASRVPRSGRSWCSCVCCAACASSWSASALGGRRRRSCARSTWFEREHVAPRPSASSAPSTPSTIVARPCRRRSPGDAPALVLRDQVDGLHAAAPEREAGRHGVAVGILGRRPSAEPSSPPSGAGTLHRDAQVGARGSRPARRRPEPGPESTTSPTGLAWGWVM